MAAVFGCPKKGLGAERADKSDGSAVSGRTFTGTFAGGERGSGGEGLRAASGMRVVACSFRHLETGVRIAEPVRHLTIEGCHGESLYRLLDNTADHGLPDASVSDFVIRKVRAEQLKHGLLRLRYHSTRGLIEDVTAICDESGGGLYCVGFQLDGQASHITYRRAAAHGFRETTRPAGKYWNGDGFSDERGNEAIRYIDCLATDCTDGGFDCKSAGVVLEHCVSSRNKRNFRLWNSGELHDCESHDPVWRGGSGGKAHFSFHGTVGTYRLVRPVVRASNGNEAPVFLFHTNAPAHLIIEDADIEAPSAPFLKVEGGPPPTVEFRPTRTRQRVRTAS
jgi:hypothetical protein